MNYDFALNNYLPFASFAIAVGGLLVRLFAPAGPARETLIVASFIFLLLGSAFTWQKNREKDRLVKETAAEIIQIIGNDKKTYDSIVADLRQPNPLLANLAIEQLIREQRIGSEPVTIVCKNDKEFRVRLYFVRSFQ